MANITTHSSLKFSGTMVALKLELEELIGARKKESYKYLPGKFLLALTFRRRTIFLVRN